MTPLLPEARAALRIALQFRMSADAERHVRLALTMLGDPHLRTGKCERDGEPCAPECTRALALAGRCGRQP